MEQIANHGSLAGTSECPVADNIVYEIAKRVLDILVAAAGLILFSPLLAAIAIAIRVTSAGPILYVTDTVGRDGKIFRIYKFRTMVVSDESTHKEYLARFVQGNEPYTVVRLDDGSEQKIYKIVNDSRVTSIGKFLRTSGLDEAPQLINVLKGEMSVVGPRPPRPAEYEHYDDWHRERLTVMPGITGLYQITARSVVPFEDMVRIDLEYIRKRSFWLDLKIMILTAKVMILHKGGY
ncbi:MAG: sugar transferase [Chloroflexi bacterium]|nr:sugar transferase [Chloroflexota bacterium]